MTLLINSSYNVIGNREDLTDVLTNISPVATPFFSTIGRTTCSNTLHEWQTDTLAAANKVNAADEGASATMASAGVTTRVGNRTQIFQNVVSVSNTQIDGMNAAGKSNEWEYQMTKRAKEIARDIESALVQSSAQSGGDGSAGTARRLEGLGLCADGSTGEVSSYAWAGWLSATQFAGSTGGSGDAQDASGRSTLTEVVFNDLLQAIWTAGGRPDMVLVGGYQKRVISSFSANATRFTSVEPFDKRLSGTVMIYESDFGVVQIRLSNFTSVTRVGAFDSQYYKTAIMRPLTFTRLAKDGDRERGQFVTELTLEAGAPLAGGMLTCLASASGATAAF